MVSRDPSLPEQTFANPPVPNSLSDGSGSSRPSTSIYIAHTLDTRRVIVNPCHTYKKVDSVGLPQVFIVDGIVREIGQIR